MWVAINAKYANGTKNCNIYFQQLTVSSDCKGNESARGNNCCSYPFIRLTYISYYLSLRQQCRSKADHIITDLDLRVSIWGDFHISLLSAKSGKKPPNKSLRVIYLRCNNLCKMNGLKPKPTQNKSIGL